MIHSSETATFSSELQRRLADVLDEYLQAVEGGAPVEMDEFISRYPDLSGPLREYLPSLEWLHDGVAEMQAGDIKCDAIPGTMSELGDYQLVREVGRGGMGIVYEAQQRSLNRRVALKVLPFASVLDRKQILRFQNEARAAAQLHHPNIVPVHGVGVDRGVHFYAMQFIEGRSLQQAINELRLAGDAESAARFSHTSSAATEDRGETEAAEIRAGASTCRVFSTGSRMRTADHCRAVAGLGVQAADAIHSAHDCGVIHRDVKPSNLMLDEGGKLWVTDFGLARYQADANCTASGEVLGTLHYMSPEQAQGNAALIDHRTDVYSLGVTLFELLTLRRPFSGETHTEVMRQIELGQYRRVRQCNKAIPKDLENIVEKSMSTRREDRYATAQELSDDLNRFLAGKPTQAHPPTLVQHVGKWARRHQRGVALAAVLTVLVSMALLAGTVWMAHQKSKTEAALAQSLRSDELAKLRLQLAISNLEEARSAVDRLGSRASELLAQVPGTANARRELLMMVIDHHSRLLKNGAGDQLLRSDAAMVHAKIARVYEQLGDHQLALREYQQARQLYRQLRVKESDHAPHSRQLAICLNDLGLLNAKTGQHELAGETLREAIAMQSELLAQGTDAHAMRVELALSWNHLGLVAADQRIQRQALDHYRTATDLLQATVGSGDAASDATAMKATRALGNVYHNLSRLLGDDDPRQALQWSRKSVEIQERLAMMHPDNLDLKSDLATAYNNVASLGGKLDSPRDGQHGIDAYTKATRLHEDLIRQEPFDVKHRRNLAVTLNNKGMALTRLSKAQEAQSAFAEAIRILRLVSRDLPVDLTCSSQLGGMYNNLAMILDSRGDRNRAAQAYATAIRYQLQAFDEAPHVVQFRDYLSRTYVNYGRLLRQCDQPQRAIEMALRRRDLWLDDPDALYTVAEEIALACQQSHVDPSGSSTAFDELHATVEMAIGAGWRPHRDFHEEVVGQTIGLSSSDSRLTLETIVGNVQGKQRD